MPRTTPIDKVTALGFRCDTNNVDPKAPLLYQIAVTRKDTGEVSIIYVGQSKNGASRPFTRYDLNIRRQVQGLPPLNGRMYRPIHFDLLSAYQAGHQVSIQLVRNIDTETEDILVAEAALQAQLNLLHTKGKEQRHLSDDGSFISP